MDFWNLKKNINQLIGLVKNWKVHIKFHSKLIIVIQYVV
jgi:hypothetical protein